ncbi:Cycloserine biosynthesis protein DcsG [Trichoplax sp. H2]|uniref:Prokaryotic glutathione synthetase ATP-binding domain-containing protein n=1 Tax=Trichoplax adhaerens TaxID=10228 RepID=B3RMB9_TRIAD|nr:hypothetical protein TRIADDRAFT_53892 [Trichoplax adhaerens]EDV28338.1 hypothetical protein TRIADDRAFT_53892 [Trichoplax adhaerens]RDD45694.1 Cycloserine biosynthesis protein DcsG [Trichoplax sp. H2]|eukprot:XP_002110172.1 hypothetical protein TRIADDRAFT_53892 [Trichoplax adhaerens]
MIDVAIVTESCNSSRFQDLPDHDFYRIQSRFEESLLIHCLRNVGLTAIRVAWDIPFEWETVRCAIIRSTWNYSDYWESFKEWIHLTEKKTILINSADLCLWNIDKNYLFEFQEKKIPIVETIKLCNNDLRNIDNIFNKLQTQTIVVKPAVSAAAKNTFKIKRDEIDEYKSILTDLISQKELLAQPFMEAYTTKGEMSFVVIDGKLTHSVLKVAKKGEFKIQDDYGGYVFPYTASDQERHFAENVVEKCRTKPAYARVDAIYDSQNQLLLSEFEILEPELFFRFDRRCAHNLATLIQNLLNRTNKA